MNRAFSYWGVGLSTGFILAFWGGFEAAGLWMGFVAGLVCAAVLLTARFRSLEKRCFLPEVPLSEE